MVPIQRELRACPRVGLPGVRGGLGQGRHGIFRYRSTEDVPSDTGIKIRISLCCCFDWCPGTESNCRHGDVSYHGAYSEVTNAGVAEFGPKRQAMAQRRWSNAARATGSATAVKAASTMTLNDIARAFSIRFATATGAAHCTQHRNTLHHICKPLHPGDDEACGGLHNCGYRLASHLRGQYRGSGWHPVERSAGDAGTRQADRTVDPTGFPPVRSG